MKNFIFSNPYATSIIKASLVQLKSMVTILLRTDHNFFLELTTLRMSWLCCKSFVWFESSTLAHL